MDILLMNCQTLHDSALQTNFLAKQTIVLELSVVANMHTTNNIFVALMLPNHLQLHVATVSRTMLQQITCWRTTLTASDLSPNSNRLTLVETRNVLIHSSFGVRKEKGMGIAQFDSPPMDSY